MLHAGLDLSRRGVDVRLLDEDDRTIGAAVVRPHLDALRTLVARVHTHDRFELTRDPDRVFCARRRWTVRRG